MSAKSPEVLTPEQRLLFTTISDNLSIQEITRYYALSVEDINYYHFQYPRANKLMKITGSKFRFKVPDDLEMHETSFAVMGHGYSPVYILSRSSIEFDGSDIRALVNQQYGKIDMATGGPDEFHDVDTGDERGSILLLYHES